MDAKQRIAPATAAKPPTSDPCNRASPPRPSAVKPINPHRIEANLFIIVALRAHANRAAVRASGCDAALYGLSAVPLYQCYQSVILFPTRNFVCYERRKISSTTSCCAKRSTPT